MNGNEWAFPFVETLHMLAIVLLVGTVALVDFRLIGWRLKRIPVSELASMLAPWTLAGFIGVLITGPLILSTDPDRYLENFAFRFKMSCLALIILLDFVLLRRVRSRNSASGMGLQRLAGAVSLVLWTGVLAGGRSIGVF